MNSIRLRLLLSLGACFLVALVASGLVLGSWFKNQLELEFDASLDARLSAISGLIENDHEGLEFDFNPAAMPEFSATTLPSYFEVRRDDDVIFRSPSLVTSGANLATLATVGKRAVDFQLNEVPLRGQRRDLIVHQMNREDDEPIMEPIALTVLVASSRSDLDAGLAEFRTGLVVAILILLVICAGATSLAVRYGLSPLAELAQQVESLEHDDLGGGLQLKHDVQELRPLVTTLEAMFLRLKTAYDRERDMTSNVAHELRTPLAELRTATELAQNWPDDEELGQAALKTAAAVSVRMERLVAALLRLARLRSRGELTRSETCDLAKLVQTEVQELESQAEGLGREFVILQDGTDMSTTLNSDPELVRLALANLLRNAVDHSDRPGNILVRIGAREWQALIAIENPCQNAANLLAEGRLTEAFWRADPARTGPANEGLGLAICAQVAATLAGELNFSAGPQTFVAELVLPHSKAHSG